MRIARLLAMDRGSALLVGVGGSGKQSLSRLAAYIRGAFTFQITITKSYNVTNLFEDIKGLYKIAAVKGQPVVFIFTDAEVKDEGFLEYINQILMTGEVAGLMPKDELDAMVNDMRPIMKQVRPSLCDTESSFWGRFGMPAYVRSSAVNLYRMATMDALMCRVLQVGLCLGWQEWNDCGHSLCMSCPRACCLCALSHGSCNGPAVVCAGDSEGRNSCTA